MPSVGSSLAIVTAAASTCLVPHLRWVLIACCRSLFSRLVVSQLVKESVPLDSECLEERIEPLPKTREGGRESVRGGGGGNGLTVAEVYPGSGRSGGRATRSLTRDDTRLLEDVALVLPSTTTERGTISDPRNPQAGELLPGGCLMVNFRDDLGWDHSRLFFWPIDANTWIVHTPDGDKHAGKCGEYSNASASHWRR